MNTEQAQLPFEAVAPNLAPVVEVGERIRPDDAAEEARFVIEAYSKVRAARGSEPRLFPNNPNRPQNYYTPPKGAR